MMQQHVTFCCVVMQTACLAIIVQKIYALFINDFCHNLKKVFKSTDTSFMLNLHFQDNFPL